MDFLIFLSRRGRLVLLACSLALSACHANPTPAAVSPALTRPAATAASTATVPARATPSATRSPNPALTVAPTGTSTPAPMQTPVVPPTPSPIPTYTTLRAEVLLRANCRYGPGAPYLYKYGLVVGSNLDVIGRNDLGTWILVQAIGGNNPCWVKASLMDIRGDVMSVAPTYLPLPQSPYYGPTSGVSASRTGDEVTISWNPIAFSEGVRTASPPYLVEAWLCDGSQLIFTPIGSYETTIKVIDRPGCAQPSHGRVFGVEKHGYTRWVEVPWPAP